MAEQSRFSIQCLFLLSFTIFSCISFCREICLVRTSHWLVNWSSTTSWSLHLIFLVQDDRYPSPIKILLYCLSVWSYLLHPWSRENNNWVHYKVFSTPPSWTATIYNWRPCNSSKTFLRFSTIKLSQKRLIEGTKLWTCADGIVCYIIRYLSLSPSTHKRYFF